MDHPEVDQWVTLQLLIEVNSLTAINDHGDWHSEAVLVLRHFLQALVLSPTRSGNRVLHITGRRVWMDLYKIQYRESFLQLRHLWL
jgi:hypothetical protein